MSYRDEDEGLRARVETLEEELAEAQATIARLQGESEAAEVVEQKPSRWLGAPTRLELERELPFEITDEGYEAIAELLRTRLPMRGEVAQVGRTLTYSFRGQELARVSRVGKGKTRIRIHGDHRGHAVLHGVLFAFGSLLGLAPISGVAQITGWGPAILVVAWPLLILASFFGSRALLSGSVRKDRRVLTGVFEAIADIASKHAVRPRARIEDHAVEEEAAIEEAREVEPRTWPEPGAAIHDRAMPELAANPAFQIYALCGAILAIHLILLASLTGTFRMRTKQWINPEDARFNKGEHVEADHELVQRVKRAHQNALENALPFFAVGLLYVLGGGTKSGAQAYFYTFTAARVLHSVFYMWGRQPFRTICFIVGVLVIVGLAVQLIMQAL